MSDEKLCPFRKFCDYVPEGDGMAEAFGLCLREKCAMWRDEEHQYDKQGICQHIVLAHCGLARRP